MYYLAQRFLDNQKKDVPEYMQLESSDESCDDFIPVYRIKELRKEARKREEEKTKIFRSFLSQTKKAFKPVLNKGEIELDRVYSPLEISRNSIDSNDSLLRFEESIYHTTIDLRIKYTNEEKELLVVITNIKNILKYEHGGPKEIKYEAKLFQNASKSQPRFKKKLPSEYFTIAKLKPISFRFFNINPSWLKTLILEVRLYGSRKRFFTKLEELLGETFIRMENVDIKDADVVTLTRSILPVAIKVNK